MHRLDRIGSRPRRISTIACINRATIDLGDLGLDFDLLISALQRYVDKHLAPVWATPAKLVKARKPRNGAWTMLFVDTADDVSNLRHELKEMFGKHVKEIEGVHLFKGRPIALIFVKTVLREASSLSDRDKISLAASHELAEMLVDPGNNMWCEHGNGTLYAYEVCDAVEARHFTIDGLAMSDFVYPAFFEGYHKPHSVQFDHLNALKAPFQILEDGFAPVKKAGKLMLLSTPKKRRQLRKEDRRLHRSEFRNRRRRRTTAQGAR